MSRFGDTANRKVDFWSLEERPTRQIFILIVVFFLWHLDRTYRWTLVCLIRMKFLQKLFTVLSKVLKHCRRNSTKTFRGTLFMLPKNNRSSSWSWLNIIIQSLWFIPLINWFNIVVPVFSVLYLFHPKSWISSKAFKWRYFDGKIQLITSLFPSGLTIHHIKHILSVLVLFSLIVLSWVFQENAQNSSNFNPVDRYGVLGSSVLYLVTYILVCIPLPFFISNFLGVVILNVFTPQPKLLQPISNHPFICFRLVTKGLYPDLVNTTVIHNLKVLNKVGVKHFIVEVVTDLYLQLVDEKRVRQIVVPGNYKTKQGSLFKARALQFALEEDVNFLKKGDWLVHLDEETLITEESVIGILNFISEGEHHFGQGLITYGHGKIVNWVTTLADSIRVGIDYGSIRFTLGILHKPIFSWKGSFNVAYYEAEKHISFDYGPEGSMAEDCFFACMAFKEGYTFGFVDGEMREKSTFTFKDFIKQRSRWMQGILLTALSSQIPFQYKIGPALMSLAGCTLPLNIFLFPIRFIFPFPISNLALSLVSFSTGCIVYLLMLGTLRTFCFKKHGFMKITLLVFATFISAIIAAVLENVSAILAYWIPKGSNQRFYVVDKQIKRDVLT